MDEESVEIVMEQDEADDIKREPCEKAVQTCQSLLEVLVNAKQSKLDLSTDDSTLCCICFESWASENEHRVVSLKCGHLFGESCIDRWLSEVKTGEVKQCPTCKTKAKKSDIRRIFPPSIKRSCPETIEKCRLELEKEKKRRVELENSLSIIEQNVEEKRTEIETLKRELMDLEERLALLRKSESDQRAAATKANIMKARLQPLLLTRTLDLNANSDPRVIASSDMLGLLVVTMKGSNSLFSEFGIKKIAASTLKNNEFIPLHTSLIKDACFHPYDAMVLTASLDKTVKLTNLFNSSAVMTVDLEEAVWSCCWNEKDPNYFYAGLRNGIVMEYDLRSTANALNKIVGTDKMPVCSLQYILNNGEMEGIISTRLRSCDFSLKRDANRFETWSLPVSGNFMSSHFEKESSNLLLSSRPTRSQPNVYTLSLNPDVMDENVITSKSVATFTGGSRADKALRSRIFPHPNDQNASLVCAGDQNLGGFYVWDTGTVNVVQKIAGLTPVLDLSLVRNCDSKQILITLTENKIYSYKWCLSSS